MDLYKHLLDRGDIMRAVKVRECIEDGHKDPNNMLYIISNHTNPLRDPPRVRCGYCGWSYSRALSKGERNGLKRIYGGDPIF